MLLAMNAQEWDKAPKCHFTYMEYQASDYEWWWECSHCGHTELIGVDNGER